MSSCADTFPNVNQLHQVWPLLESQPYVRVQHNGRCYVFPSVYQFAAPCGNYCEILSRHIAKQCQAGILANMSEQDREKIVQELARVNISRKYNELLYRLTKAHIYIPPDGDQNRIFIPGHMFDKDIYDLLFKEIHVDADAIQYGPPFSPDESEYPRIYILGQEPSFNESRTRINFSGDFGKFLFSVLKEYLPDDEAFRHIYVANLIRVYGIPKSLKHKAIKDFLPLIRMELAVFKPHYIFCLGAQALKAFTRKSITVVNENPETIEYPAVPESGQGIQVRQAKVYAFPLNVLQSYSESLNFRTTMERATNEIYYHKPATTTQLDFITIRDKEALASYVNSILRLAEVTKVHVAIDCEWNGRIPTDKDAYVRTINLSFDDIGGKPSTAVVVVTAPGGVWTFGGTKEDIRAIMQPLFDENPNIQIIGHNFIADIPFLEYFGLDVLKKFYFPKSLEEDDPNYPGIFDTIIAYHAVDETGQFALDKAAKLWLNIPGWAKEVEEEYKRDKTANGYGNISEPVLIRYAAMDAYVTLLLAAELKKHLNCDRFGNKCWKPYWINLRAQLGFLEMYKNGVLIDKKRFQEITDRYHEVRDRLLEEFRQRIRWPNFNHQSYPHVVELLFGEEYHGKPRQRPPEAISFRLTPIKTTDGKEWDQTCVPGKISPSTDLDSINNLCMQNPELRYFRDIKTLTQITKTVLVKDGDTYKGLLSYVCDDGKIHPMYSALKETRRCSCARPNLQNLPNSEEDSYRAILGDAYIAPIRSVIVAPPGYKLVEIDYSGAELLLVGVAAEDKNLIEDYYRSTLPDDDPNKLDIHSSIAVMAFKLDCPPTKAGLKSIGKQHLRLAAKRIIFGLNYGRGVWSCYFQLVTEGVDVTQHDVEQIVDTIYTKYDKIKPLQDEIRRRVHEQRWLANCFGSYRRFPPTRQQEIVAKMEREALNFICQSGVADAVSIAMYNFYTHPARKEVDYKFCMHNHDALVFVVKNEDVERFTKEIVPQAMKDGVKFQSCTLDGKPKLHSPFYHFELEVKIGDRWAS